MAAAPDRRMAMAEKRLRTEELLDALMRRMDDMDQAIASLKAQPSYSGEGACVREDGPRRAGVSPSEVFPPALKRVRGQKKGKGAGGSGRRPPLRKLGTASIYL
ncbi:hypothetical protein NDU88_004170 [Pleurodeles waltl]|uniref:Uncharacterized protein n=1 Tax=Pleurodeles waltl TaxID=8319 RepID=A0AAV7VHH2_PLEWA|nr:hypothetical protein NDU88_004170 [Pleurodeles waltl]